MKTDELVNLLTSDATVLPTPGKALWRALLPAALFAVVLFLWWAGLRADLAAVTRSVRFDFKVALNLLLWVAACGLLLRQVRPAAAQEKWLLLLLLVPLLLGLAVVLELLLLPREQWWAVAYGRNATWCLQIIPALGIAPLLASLWGLRFAAPERPALAGAVAGLMSAGLAGTLYAMHCTDDSPLFVGLWYGIAAGLLATVGALLGSRCLRW